jgi:hypothetical protein
MSTPIVQFPTDKIGHQTKVVVTSAMQLWFAVTVPLMVFTFLAWWGVKLFEKYQRKLKENTLGEDLV